MARTTRSQQMEESFTNLSGLCKSNGKPMGKFGRLTVIGVFRDEGKLKANCVCDCGQTKVTRLSYLISGGIKSCGCLKTETARRLGLSHIKHGHSSPSFRTPTYRSWETMKSRCCNQLDPSFKDYGGRGISVDPSWIKSFMTFLTDMGSRPNNTTLDRIDNLGDYTPSNCRWASPKVQQRNRRSNRMVVYKGETMPLVALSEKTGVPYQRLHERIVRRNWAVEDAVNKPPKGYLIMASQWGETLKLRTTAARTPGVVLKRC